MNIAGPNQPDVKPEQKLSDALDRPHVWIRKLTFNDGTTLNLSSNEIVVIVGPNNAGKSAVLRETHSRLSGGIRAPTQVLQDIEFDFTGTPDDAEQWVVNTGKINKDGNYRIPMIGVFGARTAYNIWANRVANGLQSLATLMTVHLNTEARLAAANPTDLINFVNEVPTHPLHRLYDEDELEARMDDIVQKAFRHNLVVNRGAGRQVMLHLGERPTPPEGKDRQSSEFRWAVNELPAVHEQGDGVRAFVGVLAGVLAANRDVVFIDEPEAFLHPPQANMLGRVLADQTPEGRQLVVATHSTDFLRGILDHSSPRVRVVRIQRSGKVNYVTELGPDMVRSVWSDPLLRYSKVLDGLFHDGVIVCEGDADCRFYGAMLDVVYRGTPGADLALVYGAGKSRIASIVRALKSIGVSVRVVVDFDALSEEAGLQTLVSALGGDWANLETYARTVRAAIEQRRAQISVEDARQEIMAVFDKERGVALSDQAIRNIRSVLKSGSAWGEAKRIGKAFVSRGQQLEAYERLASELRRIGLFLVEVGELEGFYPKIGAHGPAWVTEVLELDLANDPDLAAAREFASMLGRDWPSGSERSIGD
ncbi:MAG TPA: AAA family ATPase [Bellilinea sp.]|nr:AAA family ATPase [Bellilinea sp.]